MRPVRRFSHGALTRISWVPAKAVNGLLRSVPYSSLAEYEQLIRHGNYSAILFDGALIQITYDYEGLKLQGHRLVYYPPPFDFDADLLASEPLLDVLDAYRGIAADEVRLRTAFRFEFDPANATVGHPETHAHCCWEHARIAVKSPISLGHFARFVFQYFYPKYWSAHSFLAEIAVHTHDRTISVAEESMLHFSCSR